MLTILLHGANGAMGRELRRLLETGFADCAAGPMVSRSGNGAFASFSEVREPSDVVLDFSFHSATESALSFALEHELPIVIGTTGHTDSERKLIEKASERLPVFFSGNMSLGVAALCELVRKASRLFPEADVEIVEIHHKRKVDAPSGTALMLADAVKKERPEIELVCGRSGFSPRRHGTLGISSVRLGSVTGIHEVLISTGAETLSLKHEAHDRSLFAEGALRAAAFIHDRQPGLYGMEDLLKGALLR